MDEADALAGYKTRVFRAVDELMAALKAAAEAGVPEDEFSYVLKSISPD